MRQMLEFAGEYVYVISYYMLDDYAGPWAATDWGTDWAKPCLCRGNDGTAKI